MGELSELPNIGKAVEAQLIQAGICSAEELRQIGAKEAWLRIQAIDESACIHRLMALEGAVEGVKKKPAARCSEDRPEGVLSAEQEINQSGFVEVYTI